MMAGLLERLLDSTDLRLLQPRDEQPLLAPPDLPGDLHHLRRRLAPAIDDLGESLAQRPMRVHLRETQFRHRRRLEGAHHLRQTDFAAAEFFQELDGIVRCHNAAKIHQPPPGSRWKMSP